MQNIMYETLGVKRMRYLLCPALACAGGLEEARNPQLGLLSTVNIHLNMKILYLLILLSPFQLYAQTCDSLDSKGISGGIPIDTLEHLVALNCSRAKLTLAYELVKGNRIEKDSIRAIELLNDCKDRCLDCKYELFKLHFDGNPEKAYQLISEIALQLPINNLWDSLNVVNARLIAAEMSKDGIGNHGGLTISAIWYLLYYEIEQALDYSQTKHMIVEMIEVLKTVDPDQLDLAFKNAETILGKKPEFNRNLLK